MVAVVQRCALILYLMVYKHVQKASINNQKRKSARSVDLQFYDTFPGSRGSRPPMITRRYNLQLRCGLYTRKTAVKHFIRKINVIAQINPNKSCCFKIYYYTLTYSLARIQVARGCLQHSPVTNTNISIK